MRKEHVLRLLNDDAFNVLRGLKDNSIGALITDPPYGISFMNKDWDAPWKSQSGFSSPGIGDREIPWPSFGGAKAFGGTNPTCGQCGGRARGSRKCECLEPEWRVQGQTLDDPTGHQAALKDTQRFQLWLQEWLRDAHRVLKPGGVAKVFAATRTQHRLAAAMEDVGFILNPEHSLEGWGFGSGFPKYLNTSKAIDAKLGTSHLRKVIGVKAGHENFAGREDLSSVQSLADGVMGQGFEAVEKYLMETAAGSPEAAKFEGFGTALKPGWEPFVVGFKRG